MGAVAGFAAVDVAGFAYVGGWLRPDALTPPRFADRFEHIYGRHDGFRRNHAKGLSATGTFVSSGAGAAICWAAVCRTRPTSPTPSAGWGCCSNRPTASSGAPR